MEVRGREEIPLLIIYDSKLYSRITQEAPNALYINFI